MPREGSREGEGRGKVTGDLNDQRRRGVEMEEAVLRGGQRGGDQGSAERAARLCWACWILGAARPEGGPGKTEGYLTLSGVLT